MALNRAAQNWPDTDTIDINLDEQHDGTTIAVLEETVDEVMFPSVQDGETFIDWLVRTR